MKVSNVHLSLAGAPDEAAAAAVQAEIQILEAQLAAANAKLHILAPTQQHPKLPSPSPLAPSAPSTQNLHLWLLLADSALPIGSFAFSSALESYILHHPLPPSTPPRASLTRFLRLSLLSVSTTTVPFIAAAFRSPQLAPQLDDTFDATTTCEVARRASLSQGRALCSVWEKSFARSFAATSFHPRTYNPDHFGVAWGYITRLTGVLPPEDPHSLHQVLFVFLFNHVKALLSAAVRLSLVGPYIAQQILAAEETCELVLAAVERGSGIPVESAGQSVPAMDLWQGRHEKLYTRIFNS
ncbi:hypothetical protein DRE_06214 [Drechslerella stenobrocha 248]|uniref:Urease accessory protein UreF n=1 Tax=Drechslerella stenobrocha 248 TaxID=1043628 RepID=W7I7X1_9PEZI|nr:hypothetical protein DRE_06214 [Drechslerella stenobrocha 248]